MVKKLVFIILICAFTSQANAQGIFNLFSKDKLQNRQNHDKKKYRWGYYLGLNGLDYNIDYVKERAALDPENQDIEITKNLGFNVGLIGNLRINDHLDLRTEPGVIFNDRQLLFPNINGSANDQIRDVKATSVYIPLLVKFSTKRLNNFKPFITAGLSTMINLSSNEDNPDDNSAGQFRTKTNTYNYELGFGIDFFLPYFKFTPTIRGIWSLTDEVVPDVDSNSDYTRPIEKLATTGVFLNFIFQ